MRVRETMSGLPRNRCTTTCDLGKGKELKLVLRQRAMGPLTLLGCMALLPAPVANHLERTILLEVP
jgi:hypothetical protein